jgi:hypothetical protein
MKGQFSFEQIISLIVFVSFVSYIFYAVFSNVPIYRTETTNEELRSEAYQISELLINNPGNPVDWYKTGKTLVRLGLSNETENKTNYVSISKINKLDNTCYPPNFEGYETVRASIDTDRQLSISIQSRNCPSISIDCKPPLSIYRNKTSSAIIRRLFATDQGSCYAELVFEIW